MKKQLLQKRQELFVLPFKNNINSEITLDKLAKTNYNV